MHLLGCLEAMRLFNGRGVTRLVTGKFFWQVFLGTFPQAQPILELLLEIGENLVKLF